MKTKILEYTGGDGIIREFAKCKRVYCTGINGARYTRFKCAFCETIQPLPTFGADPSVKHYCSFCGAWIDTRLFAVRAKRDAS